MKLTNGLGTSIKNNNNLFIFDEVVIVNGFFQLILVLFAIGMVVYYYA